MTVKKIEISDWKCKNGHILGLIQKDASGATSLIVYRNAIDYKKRSPTKPDVMGITDHFEDLRCDICGARRTWSPSQASFEKLMAHFATDEATQEARI